MVIIRKLDDEGNANEPANNKELMKLYGHWMNNAKQVDGTVDCRILEI